MPTFGPSAAETNTEEETFTISFRSNGTCRPHRVRITDDDTTTIDLDVDMLGMATVEGEGKE